MDLKAASVRVSSREMDPSTRREALVELIGRGYMNVDIEFMSDSDDFSTFLWLLPGIVVSSGRAAPISVRSRDRSLEGDFISLSGGFDAPGVIRSAGKEVAGGDGQSVLVRGGDGVSADTQDGWRPRILRFDSPLLRDLIPDVDDKMMRAIPAATPALRLLDAYLPLVCTAEVLANARLAQAAARHLCDLVALAVGTDSDSTHLASRRGLASARTAVIKQWVRRHMTDPALTLSRVAKAHGLAPRTIQELFHRDGTSYSSFLLAERLDHVRRMLFTPSLNGHSISKLAFEAGFNDLSYFNRTFRERFGCTPSDFRAQCRAEQIAH